jgi:hypothetical protein
MKVNKVGKPEGFLDCLAFVNGKVSVLSLAELEDVLYNVTNIPKKA